MNWNEHVKNRSRFPPEELTKFEGQHIAWSLDGTRILAGHEDPTKLVTELLAAGYRSDDFVLSFVDSDSEFGGAPFNEGIWEEAR